MKKFRVAVIGYGRSGRDIHKKLLLQLPEIFEIAVFVDADKQRQDMIKTETGCEVYSNYTELFSRNDIDFVINASFSKDHAPISIDLLNHGFNVLSEKPAAGCTEDFLKIMEASKSSGKFYHVFQQYRYAASYLKVKEVIASGVLGRIVHVGLQYSGFSRRWDWQTVQDFRGGSLLNTGPHPVDQALDLMGFPDDIEIACAMDRAQTCGDGEDYVKLMLRAPNAPTVDIEISASNAFADYTYLIQGSRGTLKGTTKELNWKYYIESDEEVRELTTKPLKNENGEPIYCRENLTFHTEKWEASDKELDDFNFKGINFYNDFYKSLTEKTDFIIKQEHILKQLTVIDEAHKQNVKKLDHFINI